jgi:hypothetical protein
LYGLGVKTISSSIDPLNALGDYGGNAFDDVFFNQWFESPQDKGYEVSGTSGASYTFGMYGADNSGQSPVTSTFSVALTGKTPPKLGINWQNKQTDINGNPIITWTDPGGIDLSGATVNFYYITGSQGNQTAHVIASDIALGTDSVDLWHLPAGEYTVFAIYNGHSDDGQIVGWSPYSNTLQVSNTGGVPAAPAGIEGTFVAKNGNTQIDLHWTNSSNNEAQFVVQRSSSPNFTADLTTINVPSSPDITDALDTSFGAASTYYYRVKAVDNAGTSGWTTCSVGIHYTVDLKFDAFIPNTLGVFPVVPGMPNWGINPYQPLIYSSATLFATDNRSAAGEPGTSRIHTEVKLDRSAIGNSSDSVFSSIGCNASHQASGRVGANGGFPLLVGNVQTGTATPSGTSVNPTDVTGSITDIEVNAQASNPLVKGAPNIIIDITWHLVDLPRGKVGVSVTGTTTQFPAFEGLANGKVVYSSIPPLGSGPSVSNLGYLGDTKVVASGQLVLP